MPNVANPRKVFNFRVEIDGIDVFEVQKATRPEVEIEQTAHGDTNHDVKTAGRVKVGNLKLEKLRASPAADILFWQWFKQCQDMLKGGGQPPAIYKKTLVLKEMDETGLRTAARWFMEGGWPCKSSQSDFDRMSSDNVIETMEFAIDTIDQLPI